MAEEKTEKFDRLRGLLDLGFGDTVQPLEIILNKAFRDDWAKLVILDNLVGFLGGGIVIVDGESGELYKECESPYEQHRGTGFANGQLVFRTSPETRYVPRKEVYAFIDEIPNINLRERMRRDVESRYNVNTWQDNLPRVAIMAHLFANYGRAYFDAFKKQDEERRGKRE